MIACCIANGFNAFEKRDARMALISARFISLLLTALAAGVVLGHVMSRAGKVALSGPLFVTVQNTLYRNWGKKVGAVEMGAFLSTLMVAFLTRARGAIFALSFAGSLCLAGMLLGSCFWLPRRINVGTVSRYRHRWLLHQPISSLGSYGTQLTAS
jgi:hypothetical protein